MDKIFIKRFINLMFFYYLDYFGVFSKCFTLMFYINVYSFRFLIYKFI